ncbi:hypothetical protein FPZ43_11820 [Mucilaginibacter pallidiroseus]|uniref:DUF4105 domain-containing protein n=1 Tax=Mucilaginibacter pallidiroseus TaxID=2599295 RepID=A0A563UC82_9SPHI|nr:hypothetical protein [Mucilaginibacter pallidiroseus]TWR28944.1 hypothetical protein FPZ43_11820 [Mucilaginibacter pallidiroseus]
MKVLYNSTFLKLFLIVLLCQLSISAQAQLSASAANRGRYIDSLSKIETANFLFNTNISSANNSSVKKVSSPVNVFDADDSELQKSLSATLTKKEQRVQLMEYLKQLDMEDNLNANQANRKLMFRFASLFTRLKMYPLAMKCFFKTIKKDRDKAIKQQTDNNSLDNNPVDNIDDLPINYKDDSLITVQTQLVKNEKSKMTTYQRIAGTFNDNKPAIAYAMLFHVKQPVPGKRKIFSFSNTGHTFITLIKYNADSTYVTCSFGFYPKKDQPLAATPVAPSSPSQLKDDSGHLWDEVVGKFISQRKFERILSLTKKYGDLEYHLSKNNCTDFSLQAASLAGISITETSGKWPLGSGNNPGVTGQALIGGKFSNTDENPGNNLFSTLNLSVLH